MVNHINTEYGDNDMDTDEKVQYAYGWVSLPRERGQERLGHDIPNYMQCFMRKSGIPYLLSLMKETDGEQKLYPSNDYGVYIDMLYIDIAAGADENTEMPEDAPMSFDNESLENNENLDVDWLDSKELGSIIVRPNTIIIVGHDFDGPAYYFVSKEEMEYLAS